MDAAVGVSVVAQSVVPAILSQSFVHASIRPCEAAVPLLFIDDVAALIFAAVLPGE